MERTPNSPSIIDRLSESFHFYANTIYPGRSPLYVNLAMRVAEDTELLKIAAQASEKHALPNLFFAAVHFLLLKGEHHQLTAFYPSLNKTTRHYDHVYPYFRSFVLEHELEIRDIIGTRFVQTNEVTRCAILVPAFEIVSRQSGRRPLALVEIGSSAGLTLLWDHYHYRYDRDIECGPSDSPVQIECELRGPNKPPIAHVFPKINWRQGVDLNPVDLNDPENVLWLRALIWPEHQKRDKQLEQAIELARKDPPTIVRGDALEILPSLIDEIESDLQLCVYHSFTLSLARSEARERLESILVKTSAKRDVFWIGFEWEKDSETPLLELARFERKVKTERKLAKAQPHGEWLEWLA
jgi:hypothetical protein